MINYLLDASYNYQAKNIAITPLKDLMGKVVILCSDGFQGSNLEEIINYSWKFPYMRKILNDDVEKEIMEGPTNSYMSAASPTKSSTKTGLAFPSNLKPFQKRCFTILASGSSIIVKLKLSTDFFFVFSLFFDNCQ